MAGGGDRDGRILLGRIIAAHGVRGEVVVRSYAEEPEAIGAYGALGTSDAGRKIELRVVRVTPKGVIARVSGIADRNGAEALAGIDLYVDRAQFPRAREGEFYHADLIGLAAVAPDGTEIGRVVGVHNFGAGDLIEIALPGSRHTELLPFDENHVPDVNIAAGRLVIVMPAPAEPDEDEPESDEPPQA
jgi:16S rRNA processing protein RimM